MTQPDPGAQSGATDPAQSGQGGTGTDPNAGAQGGAGADGGQAGSSGAQSGTEDKVHTAAELLAQRERTRAADQRAAQAEAELKALKDKDLPELEKAKKSVVELTAERDRLQTALKEERLARAFLEDNTHKWVNPRTALKLADLSKVDIDDNGAVVGLKAALDELAKSEPYLIDKGSGTGDGGGDSGGSGGKGSAGAGAPPANGQPPQGSKLSTADIHKRFPATRTRIGG